MSATSPSLKQFLKSIYPVVTFFTSHFPRSRPRSRIRRHPFRRLILSLILVLITISSSATYRYLFHDLPSPETLSSRPLAQTTHIRDRHGTELYKIYSNQNRTLVKLQDLPPYVWQAVVSIEDKNFYTHRGFSPRGILRALTENIRCYLSQPDHTCLLQGGSTITQQLVKTTLLSSEKTWQRKIRELVLSLAVENRYTKDQILEMYLNEVGFGGASYGIEEAAQTYFGKSAAHLGLGEAALLAGLPASPTTFSPFGIHPEHALARQREVLTRMATDGYITWEQAEATAASQINFQLPAADISAPHFVMYIKDLLAQKYGTAVVEQGGLDVTTSLDLSLQEFVQNTVKEETAKIASLHVGNGAALVTNPVTGEILAMVGSRDYFDRENDGQVNVTLSPRQPGSSIKPVNYALAFSRGFTPASMIDDSPITYRVPGQPPYSPVNYDNRYHGRVTLRTALASSYNVPAVKLLAANGVSNMLELGKKMGISTWDDPDRFGLSLTLGGGEITMTDLAVVYGSFANLGQKIDLHPILSVKDSQGRLLEEFRCKKQNTAEVSAAASITSCTSTPVLDPVIAFLITDILSDNSARSPTFGPSSLLHIPNRQVPVKTGTTNNLRDNWTIGFIPDRLVAVWVGNNDNTPMSYVASGITGASPIWRKITDHLLENYPPYSFSPPGELKKTAICTITGQLACSACPTRLEYFVPGTEPKTACTDDSIRSLSENKPSPPDQILRGVSVQITPPPPPSPVPTKPPSRFWPRLRR